MRRTILLRAYGILNLVVAATLLVAVFAPCAETSCSSACCEELAPVQQQVTASVQPCVPAPGPLVALLPTDAGPAPVFRECAAPFVPAAGPGDPTVSRLRI